MRSASDHARRLGLGTAQFGLAYGVSNRTGRPHEAEVGEILKVAAGAGCGYIDTAPAYGDAESVVGRAMRVDCPSKVVSKISPIDDTQITREHIRAVLSSIEATRFRLRLDQLYGVLVHRASDFAKPGSEYIVEALERAVSMGWVQRIGASVYDLAELRLAEEKMRLTLVQVPLNVLDQRILQGGCLTKLRRAGVEIHARSIFLQGLLLMDPEDIHPFFDPIKQHLRSLRESWRRQDQTPLASCLSFAIDCEAVDAVIVGVTSVTELREILNIVGGATLFQTAAPVVDIDEMYLNPTRWPKSLS